MADDPQNTLAPDGSALLLTYWGEPHLLSSPGNVRGLYRRGLEFLDGYLTDPAIAAAP
jgi:hypothetical protein